MIEQAPGNEFRRGEIVATAMGGMGRMFDGSYAEYTCVPAGLWWIAEVWPKVVHKLTPQGTWQASPYINLGRRRFIAPSVTVQALSPSMCRDLESQLFSVPRGAVAVTRASDP